MSAAPAAISQELASRSRRRWLLRAVFGACVVGAYVAAEWGLRESTYGEPKVTSAAEWKPIVDKLPLLIRGPIERRLKAGEIESKLPKARNAAERLKLLYELAPLKNSLERRRVLERIVREFPDHPEATQAWSLLIRENSLDNPLERYVAFARACAQADGKPHPMVWAAGWGLFQSGSADARRTYLVAMAESGVVAAELAEAYEELVNLAVRDDMDNLLEKAEALAKSSRKLWVLEQEKRRR